MGRMFHLEAKTLLERAASETLHRIQRDRRRVARQIQPLLEYIENHLFDNGLNVSQMMRACGVHDHSISLEFKSAVKMPPSAYIQDCRMEVAKRLLRDTSMEVSQISEILGFASLKTFSRAFGKWAAESPTSYRRQVQDPAVQSEKGQILFDTETWNRALSGGLESEQARRLIAHLEELYPSKQEPQELRYMPDPSLVPSDHIPVSVDQLQQLKAEEVWDDLQGLEWTDQLHLVRAPGRFKSPALFHFLRDRGLEEGRNDRKWGVRVSRLALEHALTWQEPDRTDGSSALWAEAWAYLGNAHRLAGELSEAEKAFEASWRYLPSDEGRNRRLYGQAYFLKACLHWYLEDLTVASELADKAIDHFRQARESRLLGQALMTSAVIRLVSNRPREALVQLIETENLLKDEKETYLEWATIYNMASCYLESGDLESAKKRLLQAKNLSRRQKSRYSLALIYQLEGQVAIEFKDWHEALERLLKARNEFVALELTGHAAMVALDLAYFHSLRRNYEESSLFVAEAIPLFESIRYYREALMALELLKNAIATRELKVEVLRKSRDLLKDLQRKPTFRLDDETRRPVNRL